MDENSNIVIEIFINYDLGWDNVFSLCVNIFFVIFGGGGLFCFFDWGFLKCGLVLGEI